MKKTILICILMTLILSFGSNIARASLNPASPFQVLWSDEMTEVKAGNPFHLSITIRVPDGYYLYADETDLDFKSLEGLFVTDIRFPKASVYRDPIMGKNVDVYRGDVVISIEGNAPEGLSAGEKELIASLRFRGCSPTLCFRPEERDLTFRLDISGAAAERPIARKLQAADDTQPMPMSMPERLGLHNLFEIKDFNVLLDHGIAFAMIIVFLAGVLTSLTPCVWPIIPVVLLFVGVHPHKRFKDNLLLASTLVLGIVITYSLLGMAAVAFGKNLGFLFQQRWFLALVVLFFIAMSLSMFGVFDVRMPRRLHARLHRLGGKGYRGAFLAGIGLGLVASPCSGPVLAALLGYVALQGSYLLGFVLLIIYGIGMGLLMVFLGACYGELAGRMRSGAWMIWMRRALGIILLFPAAFYMGSLFNWSPAGMISEPGSRVEWLTNESDAIAAAKKSNRPLMIEFTAAWCPPCRELERSFFTRTGVVAMSRNMVPLKVDATVETREVRNLINRYKVVGWPTVLFLDPDGRPYDDLRVSEYDPTAIERGMRLSLDRAVSDEIKSEPAAHEGRGGIKK